MRVEGGGGEEKEVKTVFFVTLVRFINYYREEAVTGACRGGGPGALVCVST